MFDGLVAEILEGDGLRAVDGECFALILLDHRHLHLGGWQSDQITDGKVSNFPPKKRRTQCPKWRFLHILPLFLLILPLLSRIAHPFSHVLTHLQLEGMPESAVTPVAAFACQLLGGVGTVGSNSFTIETHEMMDAQIVDIGIVSDALSRKILAEI